ncbi:MAG: M61 family metallopeptidase, partial [Terriglobales bacterium]
MRPRARISARQGGIATILLAGLLGLFCGQAVSAQTLAFTVTPEPAAARFHVVFQVAGASAGFQDFEMPAWMPGYYRLMDYAQYVSGFRAQDGTGRDLGWEQVTPHTWRVVTGHAAKVRLSYDVAATRPFAADNSIAADRAFIAPPGMFLYLPGKLNRPVSLTVKLPAAWRRIATGLAPVAGRAGAFMAPNFDVLFDSPLLLGNQEQLHFSVGGVPHTIALEDVPASVDRAKMAADLRRIVAAATGLMGAIPYARYTFLLMGRGNGGIEHLNSAAIEFNGSQMSTPAEYQRWLSYVAHEYFHNFNVKRIRPLALGPFDYESENLTHMLWVSEGLTVYYEDLLLVRAGLITPAQYLDTLQGAINRFENEPGRPYQSATESSLTTWGTSGVGGDRYTTISYYDNGGILGAVLDLAIRHDSQNARSLDDVMRYLYRAYYLQDQRGFTDAEFREACEQAAGHSLAEVFGYASTTAPINYEKYFGYAGVAVETSADRGTRAAGALGPAPADATADAYLGLDTGALSLPPIAGRGGGRGRGAAAPPGAVIV